MGGDGVAWAWCICSITTLAGNGPASHYADCNHADSDGRNLLCDAGALELTDGLFAGGFEILLTR